MVWFGKTLTVNARIFEMAGGPDLAPIGGGLFRSHAGEKALVYLKCHDRFKNGKDHRYRSVVEKRRCADGRVVDRQVAYLGEINDGQKAAWEKCIEVFDEVNERQTLLVLYPADRSQPAHAADYGVQLKWQDFSLRRPRQ